jgi:DNA-directed RNA polymerase subunit RPC12/RpoP
MNMSSKIPCPSCGRPVQIPDEASGSPTRCTKCGRKVPVPARDTKTGDAPHQDVPSGRRLAVVLLVLAVAVPGVIYAIFSFWNGATDVSDTSTAENDPQQAIDDVAASVDAETNAEQEYSFSLENRGSLGTIGEPKAVHSTRNSRWWNRPEALAGGGDIGKGWAEC